MATFEIPLIAGPQSFQASLNAINYYMRLTYRNGYFLDIADTNHNPILSGIALVTGIDLLSPFAYLGFGGTLQVQSDGADPYAAPTYANLGTASHLYWTPI